MAEVQPTNLNAYYADLSVAEQELEQAKAKVESAKARLVAAGGKVPKAKPVEEPKAKKAPAKKGNGKK